MTPSVWIIVPLLVMSILLPGVTCDDDERDRVLGEVGCDVLARARRAVVVVAHGETHGDHAPDQHEERHNEHGDRPRVPADAVGVEVLGQLVDALALAVELDVEHSGAGRRTRVGVGGLGGGRVDARFVGHVVAHPDEHDSGAHDR